MKKYTMEQIRSSLTGEKNNSDSLLAKIFSRPLSFPVTYLFINAGASAWAVSYISSFVALLGCLLFMINDTACKWVAIALLLLWTILDCVDGNIARVKHTQGPMGEFMDAESGYIISAFLYFSVGFAAYSSTKVFANTPEIVLALGSIASISDILARLIHQRFINSSKAVDEQKKAAELKPTGKGFTAIRKRISAEMGISGAAIILIGIGFSLNLLDYVVILYFLYSSLSALAVYNLYAIKAK